MNTPGRLQNSRSAQVRDLLLLLSAAPAVAVVAFVVGSVSWGLPLVCVLSVCLVGAFLQRDLLLPVFRGHTVQSAHRRPITESGRVRRLLSVPLTFLAAGISGVAAYLLAGRGIIAVGGVVGLLVIAFGLQLAKPLIVALVGVRTVEHARPTRPVPARNARRPAQAARAVMGLVAVGASSVLAFFVGGMGIKGAVATAGLAGVVISLSVVRNRTVFVTFGTVASLVLVLHKSFGNISVTVASGAVSVYLTTFDLMVLLCYASWAAEGSLVRDIREAFRGPTRRLLTLPLWCVLALLPSVLVASDALLSLSELVRMGWMYVLFVFVAVRVRTRDHVWAILGGLVVFACIELLVVVLQWRTGGVLGLDFLGVPKELGERVTNDGSLGRPFGTIIHPVFMGAAMGSLGLLALGLACTLRRSLTQRVALACIPVCVLPLYLSHTRASLVAFAVAAAAEIAWCTHQRWLSVRALRIGALVTVLVGLAFAPNISAKVSENFGTAHYGEEVRSRLELNDVAGQMIADDPVVGVGLNNFQEVMGPYQPYGLIFQDNPVHNLYLLMLSETGIIGFLGFAALGVGLYAGSMRLARSRNRLHAGVGIGVTAMIGFLAVEEILGFSLRQDIPLALFWLLCGLSLSCTAQGYRDGTLPRRAAVDSAIGDKGDRRHGRAGDRDRSPIRRRPRATTVLVGGTVAAIAMGSNAVSVPTGETRSPSQDVPVATDRVAPGSGQSWEQTHLLISATDRQTGRTGIYRVDPAQTDARLITPDDGRVYSWPMWSPDARKVVYTVRSGRPGVPEEIEVMNPDGTGVQRVTDLGFRTGQPKFSLDQRSIVFSALSPNFARVALYSIDLASLRVTNLSAVSRPVAAVDADPRVTPDGRIVFSEVEGGAESVNVINADGTGRRVLIADGYFNTDADFSPDGRRFATASFRGGGDPQTGGRLGDSELRIDRWHLVVHELRGKSTVEHVLTKGVDCTPREVADSCGLLEGSAFTPRWSPDGAYIAYTTTINREQTCICVVDAQGLRPSVRFMSSTLAINWFDWTDIVPRYAGRPIALGSDLSRDHLLITAQDRDGKKLLLDARPDLSRWDVLPTDQAGTATTPATSLQPEQASWSADRELAVFSARTGRQLSAVPHPAPPLGQVRTEAFVLDDLRGVLQRTERAGVEDLQIFLRQRDGRVTQLTDGLTEDWRDAHHVGDLHGNVDPVLTPDGKTVVFTSISSQTGRSSVMSLDVRTGAVTSLSNATAGAVPTSDEQPVVSPDGRRVAFVTTVGAAREIVIVNLDGGGFVQVTDDGWYDSSPAWSPNGKTLAFSSFRARPEASLSPEQAAAQLEGSGWVIVTRDVSAFTAKRARAPERVLATSLRGPSVIPTWSPRGDTIVFIARGRSSTDLYSIPVTGGAPRPVAVTPYINEIHVDWR